MEEQQRIVARIKECLGKVDEVEAISESSLADAAKVYGSAIRELFIDHKDKYPGHALEDLSEIKGGGTLPKGEAIDNGAGSTMLFKVGDMNLPENQLIAVKARAYIDSTAANSKALPKGTIILPKRGGAISTNKKRILGRPAILDPNLMGIVPDEGLIMQEYLLLWFENFDLSTLASGSTVPQLNRKDLAPLKIPVPPLNEQAEAVNKYNQFRQTAAKIVTNQEDRVNDMTALRESILHQAFSGEL